MSDKLIIDVILYVSRVVLVIWNELFYKIERKKNEKIRWNFRQIGVERNKFFFRLWSKLVQNQTWPAQYMKIKFEFEGPQAKDKKVRFYCNIFFLSKP